MFITAEAPGGCSPNPVGVGPQRCENRQPSEVCKKLTISLGISHFLLQSRKRFKVLLSEPFSESKAHECKYLLLGVKVKDPAEEALPRKRH